MKHRRSGWPTGRSARDEGGATAVEFALILIPLLLLLFGIIQYGFYFFASQNGNNVARDLVRRVAVGDCPNQSDLEVYATNHLGSAYQGGLDVDREYRNPDGSSTTFESRSVGDQVIITLTFNTLDMNLPFIPVPNDASGKAIVSTQADARLEDKSSSGACT